MRRSAAIAITGTHSTGKTTFLADVASTLRADGYRVGIVADLGEQAQNAGMPVLWRHNWTSTLWIMSRGIADEIQLWNLYDVILIDRPVPDALGYYRAALRHRNERPDPGPTAILRSLATHSAFHYDLVFRTVLDPELPLGSNKERDGNLEFRSLVDGEIADVLRDLEISHHCVTIANRDREVDRAVGFVRSLSTASRGGG